MNVTLPPNVENRRTRGSAWLCTPSTIVPTPVKDTFESNGSTPMTVPLGTSELLMLMLLIVIVVVVTPSEKRVSGLAVPAANVGRLAVTVPGATAVVKPAPPLPVLPVTSSTPVTCTEMPEFAKNG